MIKSILLVALLAIFVATIQAANPFDTTTRPFVIGGQFKRVESKTPGANFACYNTTLGDWSEYKWMDATAASSSSVVQLKNGHTITLYTVGNNKGLIYWNLESVSVITTTATVMETTDIPVMHLSYDQKKLYLGATFNRVGTNTYTGTSLTYKIFSFDISSLPTLPAPTEITSNYGLTPTLSAAAAVHKVSNNNQLLFVYAGPKIVVFDPTSTSWKEINPTSIRSGVADFKLSSSTGELYAKSYDIATPYATSFWKYDPAASDNFSNVKTLASSTYISAGSASSYVKVWTVGGNAIYYAVQIDAPSFTNFETGMQNIQKISLTPSASDPVALSKTRLTTTTTRSLLDTQPISAYINSMYYDENTKQLIVNLNSETSYQVYGTRDSDSTKQVYDLTYRFQPMGRVVAYDATAEAFTVPYGGAFVTDANPLSAYSTSSVTCFTGITNYFRTWAPYFAVYDQGKDMFVAENLLSGKIDYDWLNSADSKVNAVENSDNDGIVYVGGTFRTISGTVYNSIVARTKTGLVALGTGLRKHSLNYNMFDTLPGTVKKIVRSQDNKYLFVSGDFNRAGDVLANGLAYWNIEKKTWNKLESNVIDGTNGNDIDMDYDGRYLYVVGSFTKAGKYVVKNAARFDMESQTWLPMNAGLNGIATSGIVVDGKFVAMTSSGSGVNFISNLAVWSSNSWKAIQMDSVSNSGCYSTKEVCTSNIAYVSATYYKGKIYFIGANNIYVSDTSMSKGTLFLDGSVIGATAKTKFFNYPKTNTIAVATTGATDFIEYNIDTKNIQHTTARDSNVLADGFVNALSAAPKNVVAVIAMIVTLAVTLLF